MPGVDDFNAAKRLSTSVVNTDQGQRLPFRLEPGYNRFGIHAQLDDLERDPAANRLLLFGHVNDAATTFTNLLQKLVAANPVPGFLGWDDLKTNCVA